METPLQLLGALAAAISAWMWNAAAAVPVPPLLPTAGRVAALFTEAMRRQTKLNARAATAASFTAAFQAFALLAHLLNW
jgi:hypothetical protein